MLKNSMRQMFRTPKKTVCFFLLVFISCVFVTLGTNLYAISRRTQTEAEKAFMTIGMVQQKPSEISMKSEWNPRVQDYTITSEEKYDRILSDEILDIEGMPYVHKPKQQPFYMAHSADYVVRNPDSGVDESWMGIAGSNIIAEVEPLEDCVPDHPVRLRLKKTLYGKLAETRLNKVWYWDFYNPEPEKLYAGKTYVMAISMGLPVDVLMEKGAEKYAYATGEIWLPWIDNEGSQYDKSGKRIKEEGFRGSHYSELTDDFYETEEGKRWKNIIEGFQIADYSIPVIPTEATGLLMYFYEGNAGITEGRDILEEEYERGDKVCLIEQEFAWNNHLGTGDSLRLPLYYANYRWAANVSYPIAFEQTMDVKLIDAKGELYQPFEDSEYTVVGIYQTTGGEGNTGFEAAKNGVIIPAESVKKSDENHVIDYGPMKENTTVFQLENGSIDEFMAIWKEKGSGELDIRFLDQGYSKLEQSFRNMKRMSVILFWSGMGLSLLVLIFFCNSYINGQKIRMAIERSMGVTRKKCRRSIVGGVLLIILLGSIIGCTTGMMITGTTVEKLSSVSEYSEKYSNHKVTENEPQPTKADPWMPIVVGGFYCLLSFGIAEGMAGRILRKEPLELLALMEQEK